MNSGVMFYLLFNSVLMKAFSRCKKEIWYSKLTVERFSIFILFCWFAACFNLLISFLRFDILSIKDALKATICAVKSSAISGSEKVLGFFYLGVSTEISTCICFSLYFKDSKFTVSYSFSSSTHSGSDTTKNEPIPFFVGLFKLYLCSLNHLEISQYQILYNCWHFYWRRIWK